LHVAVCKDNVKIAELLIDNGIDVNITNCRGETALFRATERKHKTLMELLIAHGADINIKSVRGSPLHYAAMQKNKELMELLLNENDKRAELLGWNALHKAVWESDEEMVRKLLLTKVDVNVKDDIGFTPLNYAILKNDKKIIGILIKNGADINGELIRAVKDEDAEKIKLLIELGADVNAEYSFTYSYHDYKNVNVLFQAVLNNNLEIINILIEAGVDVNKRDGDRKTPLFYVSDPRAEEMIKILCKAGADINAQDKYGNTALMYATPIFYGNKNVNYLIQAGADVNIKNKKGETALDILFSHYLFENPMIGDEVIADLTILKLFIKAGALADVQAEGAYIYFILAAREGEKEIVQYFIESGININKKDSYWHTTALITAAKNVKTDIVKLLIAEKADLNLTDDYGNTAIDYARENGYDKIVTLLEQAENK
jgi:ankyrin repeat protein